MTDFSLADFYVQALSDLDSRYRFTQCSNLISNLTDIEKECAMFDALQDINSLPPQTSWTLADLLNPSGDPRWIRWFYLATARNCVRVLISDWTQNGFEDVIDEFKVEDRLERYQKFAEYLDKAFHDGATELKETSQKFFESLNSYNQYNPVVRFKARVLFADGRAWRGGF